MNLLDIIRRNLQPEPWVEGEKIAWDDPAFSARVLAEHLSQEHDEASRRTELIDAQVAWIHNTLLEKQPAHIVDLCCGPGLYTSRLAKLGHSCAGIDFSPATIGYAEKVAKKESLRCAYAQEDIRHADYGEDNDLVMMLFGEANVFKSADLREILRKIHAALGMGGMILLEGHHFDALRELGEEIPSWYSEESGLFSTRPHLCLTEHLWDDAQNIATVRHAIIDAESGKVSVQASNMQAYTDDEYEQILLKAGFDEIVFHPSFGEVEDDDFWVITGKKK